MAVSFILKYPNYRFVLIEKPRPFYFLSLSPVSASTVVCRAVLDETCRACAQWDCRSITLLRILAGILQSTTPPFFFLLKIKIPSAHY